MKTIPTVQKYMTTTPHSIGSDQTLATADDFMAKHRIRHLPVLRGGELVGLITDRDLKMLKGFKGVDPKKTSVNDLSVSEVFTISPSAPLNEVCETMAEKKFGCALVMDHGKLVGIFTWVDALRAMAELMKTRLK